MLSVTCILDLQRLIMPVASEVDYKFPKIDLAHCMIRNCTDEWLAPAIFWHAIVGGIRDFNCEHALQVRRIGV